MKSWTKWIFGIVLISRFFIGSANASTIAPVKLSDLFKQADLVAAVEIVSGDGENYPGVVYKAKVLTAFKGIDEKETIFFGPFAGYGVGKEYVVFLSKSEYGLKPNQNADSSRGGIPVFYRIMYDGFSILPSDYECVFDGKAISQECDYSVELNPDQIILPSQIQLFPAGDAGPVSNYCKWVRKSVFFSLLNTLRKSR